MKVTSSSVLSLLFGAAAVEAFHVPSVQLSSRSTKLYDSDLLEKDPMPKLSKEEQDKKDDKAFTELKAIASKANPIVNYYDPLDLVGLEASIGDNKAETIAFLRHAEIKHSRVAMAAFVGYCVQSQYTWSGVGLAGPWPSTDLGPEAQWDALPLDFKLYIVLGVGFLEILDECDPEGHYMRGREPGRVYFYQGDTRRTAEELADGRVKEINNGRLAMLGIMAFVSSASIPGSVPLLNSISIPYSGNFWAPFQGDFTFLDQLTTN
mmetsp:Transcript_19424/g.21710  ORF Transcript_19424/g.21710 Transcript_19424/m.21710 type:complete len:264 (+) Transcript_19424:52-843(+)